ncbi:DUF2523 family protein [Chromobacterium violaceum]|uniref:DUF2523 family protein n=1 Tax=Chromobacterium violaceum TaxID=536 RepID=UPI001B32D788|nr:DUF2523 family protein [Chromobacterium violaceum]MBP4045192.1 DUF2523 domain-containing protein [Chromobacterium violaceum]MBX9269270.1 DUF2523 domain-containing protein [Chromobacterium violaceum]
MFGIVLSALNAALAWLVRSVLVKFVAYFALWFITTEFIQVLQSAGLFPTADSLTGALGGIPAAVWYFLDLFAFSQGLPIVLAAVATRFIIRRIPVIG